MPTCLVCTTSVALTPLAAKVGGPAGFWLIGWLWANVSMTYALGVFDQKLNGPTPPPEHDAFASEVASFVVLQVFLVPSLLLTMWLIASLIVG
jgi:hypothetical protein